LGQSSISRFLHHLNLRFKKKVYGPPSRSARMSPAARKALQKRQQGLIRALVFIDETSVSTTIARLYGWAPQGERLVQKLPHGNGKPSPSSLRCAWIALPRLCCSKDR